MDVSEREREQETGGMKRVVDKHFSEPGLVPENVPQAELDASSKDIGRGRPCVDECI